MQQSTATDGFDAAALAELLNAAFAAWALDARAHPVNAAHGAVQTDVQVQCAGQADVQIEYVDGRRVQVQRYEDATRGLPMWCYGPPDLPCAAAPRAVSLGDLLVNLRMELDSEYAPQPLIPGGSRAIST